MKLTKRENDRFYDENNNSWITEQLATVYSPTLINCRYCSDCSNCSNCSSCISCYICVNCSNCSECYRCRDCISLYRHYNEEKLKPQKYDTEDTIIRPELDINNRRLEIEL
jgi:hypothetical protein